MNGQMNHSSEEAPIEGWPAIFKNLPLGPTNGGFPANAKVETPVEACSITADNDDMYAFYRCAALVAMDLSKLRDCPEPLLQTCGRDGDYFALAYGRGRGKSLYMNTPDYLLRAINTMKSEIIERVYKLLQEDFAAQLRSEGSK